MPHRPVARALVALLGLSGLVLVSAPASTASADLAPRFATRVDLPAGFQPEGIAIDRAGRAYFGSVLDGDIYATDLRTGRGRVVAQGPGTAAVGMKVDRRGRLFVAGGRGGDARVIDTSTGQLLASYTLTTTSPTFVNDVILAGNVAWFSDSSQPVLYKVPLGRHGELPAQSAVQTIPLSGDYVHDPAPGAFNGNGLSRTPDGRGLILAQTGTGLLFRVDPRTGATERLDLGGALLIYADGLLLSGRTLYVVQNRLNKMAVLDLDSSGTTGRLVREITSPDFDIPATVAAFGSRLYLPNGRFTTPPTPTTPYWAAMVHR